MDLDDWLLALHLVTAAALLGGLVLLASVAVSIRSADAPAPTLALGRLANVGTASVIVGTTGTLIFGVWLAVSLDGVEIWDGWVIAGIVLWALATGAGQRAGAEYDKALDRAKQLDADGRDGPDAGLLALNRTSLGAAAMTVSLILAILVLAVMIWKPGA
ncbi:MAG: hypothetical protein AB7V42_09725 [Thermoleophilia bacterium]